LVNNIDGLDFFNENKEFILFQKIFEYQKLENPRLIKMYKESCKDVYKILERKFNTKEQNSILIFSLKKLKKRNEEMNKLVIKKAMKSMMNLDKEEQLKRQHTNNILSLEE
jgi:hypothetical protein